MILKVIGDNGEVLHDCRAQGCSVSWDGYALRDLEVEDIYPDAARRPSGAARVPAGRRLPNAGDPDARHYDVAGEVAKLKQRR